MEEQGTITINTAGMKNNFEKAKHFFKQKKVIYALTAIILIVFLIWGTSIRMQNVDALKDSTTGKYIPADPDSIYFLRIAETLNDQGSLPEFDEYRQPFDIPYPKELLPYSVVYIYKVAKVFDSDVTLEYSDVVLYMIVFFILGVITFFLFVYAVTKSKLTALISSVFLTVIPGYLFRTMPGIPDHEPIGMFSFFLALFVYAVGLNFLDKDEKGKNFLLKTIIFSALTGLFSVLTIASWGGIANFIFMIIPVSFGLFWILKTQLHFSEEQEEKHFFNYLIFYAGWFFSTFFFSILFGYGFSETLSRVTLASTSILSGFFLLFIFVDFFFIKKKSLLKGKLHKYRIFVSLAGTIILGIVLASIFYGSVSSLFADLINRLLHPFGTDRVSVTVSENQQPYLNDWIGQMGKMFFWLFFAGLVTLGINISASLNKGKHRFIFVLLWIVMLLGIIFSRISPSSMFNGTNFVSKLFYFGSIILFFGYLISLYFKERIKIDSGKIIIFTWTIFMLIVSRGALRTFFLITPFVCFSVGYLTLNLANYAKKDHDDLIKMILNISMIIVIILSLISLNSFITVSGIQAQGKGPIGGQQWQQAMKWVRENTAEGSIFVHWWDYGYMVQYMGRRPTLADGGHFEGAFRDHMIGRYLLTNPNPESALSFMKSNNVSYLLIDPTDIGKYGAYSSIGSDSSGTDRLAFLPVMGLDRAQTRETNTSEIRFYNGAANIDEDIIYNDNGENIFLPERRAAILGFLMETQVDANGTAVAFKQPEAVFVYNQQQITIPIRYLYSGGKIRDFGSGLEAGVVLIPAISASGNQLQIDHFGASIYLSPKVFQGLVAQLYIMDDPFNRYPTVTIAHSQQDPFVESINAQGGQIGDLVFFNGLVGSLKIWKTDYPSNILVKEEFVRQSGEYAEFDNLTVTA